MKKLECISCDTCPAWSLTVFQVLNQEEGLLLTKNIQRFRYRKGDPLFQEGDTPRHLFCMGKGKAKVVQHSGGDREQILHMVKAGDLMGYRAILGNDTYSCSGEVTEDTDICHIPRDIFEKLLERNPALGLKISRMLALELREAELKITQMALRPVKERVAGALLSLLHHYGFEDDQVTLNYHLKREELANMTGTTRETATRMLYVLQKNGWIQVAGKKIRLLNLTALKEWVDTPSGAI